MASPPSFQAPEGAGAGAKFTLGSEGPVCAGGPGVVAGGRGGFPKVRGRPGGGRGAASQAPARHLHLLHNRLVQADLRSADG